MGDLRALHVHQHVAEEAALLRRHFERRACVAGDEVVDAVLHGVPVEVGVAAEDGAHFVLPEELVQTVTDLQ